MNSEFINHEQKLFVFRTDYGYSCLGFDVARDRTQQYAELLDRPLPMPMPYATVEALALYQDVEKQLAQSSLAKTYTIYDPNTPDSLMAALERVRLTRQRIRLFYGDPKTGRDWNEENDVEGYLGRTMGPIHCPILLPTQGSFGGGIILSACIVKLVQRAGGHVLWRHRTYHSLPFSISPRKGIDPERPIEVLRAGEIFARFTTRSKAAEFIRRMIG